MSTPGKSPASRGESLGVTGVITAGVLLLVAGAWAIVVAISALVNDTLYVVGLKYVWEFDLTAWGWIQLILGIVLIVVGIYVLRGATWAAVTGMVVAGISALANFMWLPYQPIWACLMIALAVFIIWALATHRHDVRQ